MNKHTLSTAMALLLLASCSRTEQVVPSVPQDDLKSAGSKTFYGPARQLGNGVVRAWTRFVQDVPVEIGVDISGNSMNTLPHHHAMLSLELHPVKNAGNYTHVLLDWAPDGHEPAFYEVPHFDVHFYMQPESERLAIGATDAAHDILPAPQYLPDLYFPTGGVPQMGNHWLYQLAPELAGEPFTNTFIYGSYDGKVTFFEPMLTRDWLLAQTHTVVPIPQPQAVHHSGYYPVSYSVGRSTSPVMHTIAMQLEYRTAQ
jgi:hypothetical protein